MKRIIPILFVAIAASMTSCKAWRTISTTATYTQATDSTKTTTTITSKTVEEYQGVKKRWHQVQSNKVRCTKERRRRRSAMVVSFYVRIIVYVGITLPAIPSVRIAKSRQFSMDAMNKERGAALTCREGDEENIQFWVLGHPLAVQCSWTIRGRSCYRFYLAGRPWREPRRTHLYRYGLQRQYQLDLYIWCEKFPQEVISSVNYSGFG